MNPGARLYQLKKGGSNIIAGRRLKDNTSFFGYERSNGCVGVRNYVAILPSVVCATPVARRIADNVKGAVAIFHHQGCTQLGADLEVTLRTVTGLGMNPNVAAVLVVGLGCESMSPERLSEAIAESKKPVETLIIQDAGGTTKTVREGVTRAREMVRCASYVKRKPCDLSKLTLAVKCGSSDTTSGIAANPAIGVVSDMIVNSGGTVIIGETTELIGAEHILAKRAISADVAKKIRQIVRRMENRAKAMGVDMRGAQPTPGNIEGGITTIEEKSLGAIYKGGTTSIKGVLDYAEKPKGNGLYVMDTPGREPEALTGFAAGGAQIIAFTTGRGAPQGFPIVPVLKITGNPRTYENMMNDMDINAGTIICGKETINEVGNRLFVEILKVASGKMTKSEAFSYAEPVDIFRIGPTL